MKAITTTLRAEYDGLPKRDQKEKVSYGDYCNDPNIKTLIQTAKNIAIGKMAIERKEISGKLK